MTIESKHNGKVIVVFDDKTRERQVPLFCHFCLFPMKTIDDSIAFKKNGCCSKCDLYWSFKMEIDWSNSTMQPSTIFPEEWNEYIKNREISSRPILIFK